MSLHDNWFHQPQIVVFSSATCRDKNLNKMKIPTLTIYFLLSLPNN